MKAYVCIGGPLAGQFATTRDFEQERVSTDYQAWYASGQAKPIPTVYHAAGKFAEFQRDYDPYNSGNRNGVSMIWVYRPLLKKPVGR